MDVWKSYELCHGVGLLCGAPALMQCNQIYIKRALWLCSWKNRLFLHMHRHHWCWLL